MTTRDELLREAVVAFSNFISDVDASRAYVAGAVIPEGSTVMCYLYWDYVTNARATLAKIEAHLKEVEG